MTVIDIPPNDQREIVVKWKKRDGTPQRLRLKFTTVHTHDLLCVDAHGRGWSEAVAYCDEHGSQR